MATDSADSNRIVNFISYIVELLESSNLFTGSNTYLSETLTEESTISEVNFANPSTYRLDSQYDFYTDYYEDITKNTVGIKETGLPNLYIYGDDLNKENRIYKFIITVAGSVQIEPQPNGTEDYFDNYALKYEEAVKQQSGALFTFFEDISLSQEKIYYTKNGLERLEDINKNQYLMPYGNKISFNTLKKGKFSAILENSSFIDNFCRSIIEYSNTNFTNLQLNLSSQTPIVGNDKITVQKTITTQTVRGARFQSTQEFLQTVNEIMMAPNEPILSIGDTLPSPTSARNREYSTNFENTQFLRNAVNNNQNNSISRFIRSTIFSNKVTSFINSVGLTPSEFMSNKEFYTEAFMYQLDKTTEDGTVVQSFYMPNLSDIEKINIFDSQVKFGKKYNYSLKSYNFSIGQRINFNYLKNLPSSTWLDIITSVRTKNRNVFDSLVRAFTENSRPNFLSNTSGKILFTKFINLVLEVMQEKNLRSFVYYPIIFKKELFNDIMAVFDNPPPPPEIEIDGMIGIDNKILIRLNSSISEFKAKPVLIQPEDTEIFNRNVLVQKLDSLQDEMKFDGDDRPTHFQIFRLDHQPKDYLEFKDNFVTASTTYIKDVGSINSKSNIVFKSYHSSYLDTIQPNQKYYYIFRTVDVHGNVSNPSPIYEVQMVNEDGTIFPLIKTADFIQPNDKQPTKNIRRFLHIIPNALQSLINENSSGYYDENGEIKQSADLVENSIVLGLTEKTVWNKKYKLKIKSKVTGKVVEIDFKFTHNPLISE